MKKKIFIILAAICVCATLAFSLVACDDGDDRGWNKLPNSGSVIQGGNGGGIGESGTDVPANDSNSTQVIAFSAASSVVILDTMSNATATTAALATDEQINIIHERIAFVESFVGSNPVTTQVEESDRMGYAYKLSISTTDLAGNASAYTLYYNQTLRVDNDRDADDTEQEYTLDGILVSGTVEYKMYGEKEEDNGEYEMKFKAWSDVENSYANAKNYVLFEQEIENEDGESEQEFKYAVYANGALVSSFAIEIEDENGEQEIEFKSSDMASDTHIRYAKETDNGRTFIRAQITEGGNVTSFKVSSYINQDGKTIYRYEYNSGQAIERQR